MLKILKSSNTLKTYFWSYSAFIIKFLTLFIVTPFLTKSQNIYGVYSLCVSVIIYFNYIDFGFLTSAEKYATEFYINKDYKSEIETLGFGVFILSFFSLIIMALFLYFSLNPDILSNNIYTNEEKNVASKLFLILFLFTPSILIEKIVIIIFNIRLKSYIPKQVGIISNLIGLFSVYFFFNKSYQIIQYFLFLQILNFVSTFFCLIYAKKLFNYDFHQLLKSIKFCKSIYSKISNLAYSGILGTLMWIIYYEIDRFVIAKYLGYNSVAIFSISITFLTVFRTIFGILFTPFSTTTNYLIGLKDEIGLKQYLKDILVVTTPLTILPCAITAILSGPLILNWVGENYKESINLTFIFSLVFMFSFITYNANFYLIAKEKIKESILVSLFIPILYWLGIYIFISKYGLIVFPTFKLIVTLINTLFYIFILNKYVGVDFNFSIKNIILPITPSFIILTILYFLILNEKIQLSTPFLVLFVGLIILFLTFFSFIYLSKNYFNLLKKVINKF